MTNDELRAQLVALLPDLLAELRQRKFRRVVDPAGAKPWQAMAAIVKRLTTQVIYPSVSSVADSDDIAQKVLLKLQSETVILRVMHSKIPLAYLRGLARFALLDHLRTLDSQGVSLAEIGEDSPRLSRQSTYIIAPAPSPSVVALRRVLRALSLDDRRLLEMRFWRDMTVTEIAETLRQPASRVAVRLFRLISRLRESGDIP
jgi:RNA polymerase sigma factor (sigma-70 family)